MDYLDVLKIAGRVFDCADYVDMRGVHVGGKRILNYEGRDCSGCVLYRCYPDRVPGAMSIDPRYAENDISLVRAHLMGAEIPYADLKGRDMRFADLRGAKLNYSNLAGSNLQSAELAWATLNHADLQNANLQEAVGPILASQANLTGANLQRFFGADSDFRDACLQNACMDRAILYNTNLSGVDVTGASFRHADIRGVEISGIGLETADFQEAITYCSDFAEHGAYIIGPRAELYTADLRGLFLEMEDLRHANLLRANLQDARLRAAMLNYADLQYADLRGTDLREADLRNTNLEDAIYDSRTNFEGSNITQTQRDSMSFALSNYGGYV